MADLLDRRHLQVLLIAVALAGCGGDDSPRAAPPPPRTTSATAVPPVKGLKPAPRTPLLERAVQRTGVPSGAVVVGPTGTPRPVGLLGGDRAWSTIKVPLLVAYLDLKGGEAN